MAGALDAIQNARQAARGLTSWYAVTAGAQEARIRLAQGDVTAATRWVHEGGLGVHDEPHIEYRLAYLDLARLVMAQGRLDESLGLLVRLLKTVEAAGATGSAIYILILPGAGSAGTGQG